MGTVAVHHSIVCTAQEWEEPDATVRGRVWALTQLWKQPGSLLAIGLDIQTDWTKKLGAWLASLHLCICPDLYRGRLGAYQSSTFTADGIFKKFLLMLCEFYPMYPNPTHLPVSLYLLSALATSLPKENLKKKKIKAKHR